MARLKPCLETKRCGIFISLRLGSRTGRGPSGTTIPLKPHGTPGQAKEGLNTAPSLCYRCGNSIKRGCFFLEGEGDVASVSAGVLDQDFSVASLDYVGKFFAPFHQQDGVFRGQFIEAYGFQLALVFDAVEIDVVELDLVLLAVRPCAVPSYS